MFGTTIKTSVSVLGLTALCYLNSVSGQWDYPPAPVRDYYQAPRAVQPMNSYPPPLFGHGGQPSQLPGYRDYPLRAGRVYQGPPPWLTQRPHGWPGYQGEVSENTGNKQLETMPRRAVKKSPVDEEYIRDAAEIVAEADWSKQRTITVALSEYRYTPSTIRLEAGIPYKMELVNRGQTKHYFTAPEFFRAIASRKVQSNHDGEIKAPYFTALEMMANGGQLDLYFVPVRKGVYEVSCSIPGHIEQGMVGELIIE